MKISKKSGLNPYMIKCARCGGNTNHIALLGTITPKPEQIIDGRYIMTGNICKECEEEMAEFDKIVECGGVYWKCKNCTAAGVIKPGPDADNIRKALNVDIPDPCGVIFNEADCPSCGKADG